MKHFQKKNVGYKMDRNIVARPRHVRGRYRHGGSSGKVWGEKWRELDLSREVTDVENILPKLGSLHISGT
jgi:hypothetical protein